MLEWGELSWPAGWLRVWLSIRLLGRTLRGRCMLYFCTFFDHSGVARLPLKLTDVSLDDNLDYCILNSGCYRYSWTQTCAIPILAWTRPCVSTWRMTITAAVPRGLRARTAHASETCADSSNATVSRHFWERVLQNEMFLLGMQAARRKPCGTICHHLVRRM